MKNKATVLIPPTDTPIEESATDVQRQIRCRAYELYEQRGREDGHDIEHWLQAESELIHAEDSKAGT